MSETLLEETLDIAIQVAEGDLAEHLKGFQKYSEAQHSSDWSVKAAASAAHAVGDLKQKIYTMKLIRGLDVEELSGRHKVHLVGRCRKQGQIYVKNPELVTCKKCTKFIEEDE